MQISKRHTSYLSLRLRILIVFIIGFTLSQNSVEHAQTKPSPRRILDEMVAEYKAASFYQDAGSVIVDQAPPKIAGMRAVMFQNPPRAGALLVSYKTYFARPKMFRFDWKSSKYTGSREASIWFDGKDIYRWMPEPATKDGSFTLFRSKYLSTTIDEAARHSSGTVFPILSMLVAEASVVSFSDWMEMGTELAMVGEEGVEGERCFVIRIKLSGAPWVLWVSKQRHLLRKTRTVYSYGSFDEMIEKGIRHEYLAEETRRDIKLNEPISKDIFNYRPKLLAHDTDLTRRPW